MELEKINKVKLLFILKTKNLIINCSHSLFVPENLVNLQTNELKEISFITASRLFVRGSINGVTCSCKGDCKTKQCPCRKKTYFVWRNATKTVFVVWT